MTTPYVSCAASRIWYSARSPTPWRRILFASLMLTSRDPDGVEVPWQPDPAAGLDPEGLDEFGDALRTDVGHWKASGIGVAPLRAAWT